MYYDAWRLLTDAEMAEEYDYEYPKQKPIFGDVFPTLNEFKKAVKKGKVKTLTEEFDHKVEYRSRCTTLEELEKLVSTYRIPRDVKRIVKGFKESSSMPYPIILKHDNRYRIMSGNTRVNAAFILGFEPKVLIVDTDMSFKQKVNARYFLVL